MSEEKIYRPGQKAPRTGLYRVVHYQHRLPHDVVIKQGEVFPSCNRCGQRVTFSISSTADVLSADQDFAFEAA